MVQSTRMPPLYCILCEAGEGSQVGRVHDLVKKHHIVRALPDESLYTGDAHVVRDCLSTHTTQQQLSEHDFRTSRSTDFSYHAPCSLSLATLSSQYPFLPFDRYHLYKYAQSMYDQRSHLSMKYKNIHSTTYGDSSSLYPYMQHFYSLLQHFIHLTSPLHPLSESVHFTHNQVPISQAPSHSQYRHAYFIRSSWIHPLSLPAAARLV